MSSVFETLHDEDFITVREEPRLHVESHQRDVKRSGKWLNMRSKNQVPGMCEPIEGVQDCTSECPTKIICYLKEDQSEFLEERGQKVKGE